MERLRNKVVAVSVFPQAPPESIYAQILQGRQPYVIPTPTGTTVDPACVCPEQIITPFFAHTIMNQAVQPDSKGLLQSKATYAFQNNGLQPITVTLTRTDGSLLLSPLIDPGEIYTPYPNQGYVGYKTS